MGTAYSSSTGTRCAYERTDKIVDILISEENEGSQRVFGAWYIVDNCSAGVTTPFDNATEE